MTMRPKGALMFLLAVAAAAAGCSGGGHATGPTTTTTTSDARATDDAPGAGGAGADAPAADAPAADGPAGWRLTFSDEFDGAAGTAPNPAIWGYDVGGTGWGNNELEFYTNRTQNSALDGNGHLVITARAEAYMGRNYTSARLLTKGKFEQAYGRFEARAQIPGGQGLWPAFWALGNDIDQVNWPTCGEIDIMENIGREPGINHGTLHGPGYSGGGGLTGKYTLPGGAALSADFHTFAIEWEQTAIRFYVDDQLYETRTPADVPAGDRWVYDHPFFLLLNVAVGGTFPGNPDSTTVFPQTMTVDYVRVYERSVPGG